MKNAVAALRRANLAQVVVPVGGQHHAILGQQNMNALGVTQINAFALEFLNFLAANDFVGGASGMNRPAVLENHLEQMLGNVPLLHAQFSVVGQSVVVGVVCKHGILRRK